MRKLLSFVTLLIVLFGKAQMDTIVLQDLIVTDIRLEKNKTQFIQELNDSTIFNNPPLLSEILNYNTPIFFKENGYGMVSSPSFRGTTASQTAVLWNGIKINSGFLGQADFNTISSLGYDEIKVKPGGGSVAHGSGAIGGSIHLNHLMQFNQGLNGDFTVGYGSFNTVKFNGIVNKSNDKWAFHLGFNQNSSDNDYEVKKLNYTNYNGQFTNKTINLNAAHKFNNYNRLSLFIEGYEDERYFSLVEPTGNKTKYQNRNLRSLLQFDNQWDNLTSIMRLAFVNEKWEYWQNLRNDVFSQGELSSVIAKYDGTYQIANDMNLALIGEYAISNATGEGGGIDQVSQKAGNLGLMFSHQVLPQIYYELGARKEMNQDYESPFLYSFGTNFKPTDWYNLKINISKNFRAPTFNDLYWEPGGNPDLKAETSTQYELSNILNFAQNQIGINLYYNEIDNMIRWVPGTEGYWYPQNVDAVKNKGIEIFSELKHKIGAHTFQLNNSYAFTESKNQENGNQMTYVPFHKLNGTLSHTYKNFSWYLQGILVGKAFTTTDENPDYVVNQYNVFNLGLNYKLIENQNLTIGLFCRNLFDKAYEPYPYRIMPPRNYGAQLNFKF